MIDTHDTAVNFEKKGYGRGLILGLTMAETMLLLVFCLLLVAGAIIAGKQEKIAESAAMVAALENDIANLTEENEELIAQNASMMQAAAAGRNIPDEDWRKLVAAQAAAARIEEYITVERAAEMVQVTAAAEQLEIATPEQLRKLAEDAAQRKAAEERVLKAEAELADLRKRLNEAGTSTPHEWPPIISLSDVDGYSFAVGSAELTPEFRQRLLDEIPNIRDIAEKYGVDIIEVIGHTDEQNMPLRPSNLDRDMKSVLDRSASISSLAPADNAGLGLARALSVADLLSRSPELQGLDILPMSGGQLILPGDTLTDGSNAGDNAVRRRIEIRVRKREMQGKHEASLQ